MRRLLLHILRCFLPILFVTYLAGITFFAHVHVINGVTIVHSHPFKKGSAHHHTTFELLLIHFLSNLEADRVVSLASLSLFIPFLIGILSGWLQYKRCHSSYHGVTALRAPPAYSLS